MRSRDMGLLCDIFVMKKLLSVCVTIWAVLDASHGISTKMDFEEESSVTNSSNVENEDVEVKHTIVVSTKLKNNNRRGLHSSDGTSKYYEMPMPFVTVTLKSTYPVSRHVDFKEISSVFGDTGTLTYNIGRKDTKDDSGEVPIISGYKAVETTQIRTPDTRNKPHFSQLPRSFQAPHIYPDSFFINRNIRDEEDIFPNIAIDPSQWKPSNFFNNINYRSQDHGTDSNFIRRLDRPASPNQGKLHRKITEDGVKEFYCRKCRELSCQAYKDGPVYPQYLQQRNPWVNTTPKMKIDGKLAKLN